MIYTFLHIYNYLNDGIFYFFYLIVFYLVIFLMNTSFSSLLYNYESSVSVLAIQSYTPFNKRKWEKRKKKLLHQSADWCHLWICIARLDGALKEDNWLDRKATWWEELQKAPESLPRLSWGLFKAYLKPTEDTARANQRFSSAFAALNGRH